ncbi:flippase [Candidatus Peregrinibacteria bacterium]|nr:MAG: flippase [Candidatus Peregrinibacteria bacterium]
MTTAKKILGNTVIQVAGRAIMAVTSIGILKAVSHFLSVEGYGMYTAVYEFLAFFGIAADFGLFTIGVREMSKGERERSFVAGNIFGMRIVTAAVAMAIAVVAAFLIPAYQGTYIPGGVAIAALAVFFAILQGTASSVLQVELKMQYATAALVFGKLLSFGWMLAVIFYFFSGEPSQSSFNQLMFAGLVGNLFSFVYTYYCAQRYAQLAPRFDKSYWKEIFVGAFPYGIALVLNMIYFRIDSIMILFIKGPQELGFYGPAMRILEILNVIPVFFMNSVLPVLSRALKEAEESGGKAKVERILQLCMSFLYMAGLPMAIGLYLLAYPIIFLITQPEFLSRLDEGIYGSDIALQILAIAMCLSFSGSLYNYSLVALGKQGKLLWINGAAALFNISVNLWAVSTWGFRGAAWTTVATEIFILLIAGWTARRYLRYRVEWGNFAKISLAGFAMGAVVYFLKDPTYELWGLQNLNVLLLSFLGAGVYIGILFALKAFPEEVRQKVRF